MPLNPIFAEALRPFIPQPAPKAPGYWNSPAALRDEIEGLELDIADMQQTIERNTVEIPKMTLETLKCRLNVALAELKIHDLRAKLAAKNGGQQ